jgi:4-alpha-glucanotransferase
MKYKRASGILLHPTSLPGPYGIGDLGPQAHRWIDFLAESGCELWQVLPLGPTGYGDSPYQSFSAFAGNPYLISPEILVNDELLTCEDLDDRPDFPEERVDFGPLITWKVWLLDRAYERFQDRASSDQKTSLANFWAENALWLSDFALFMAIKETQGGVSWSEWPLPLRLRDPDAIQQARQELDHEIQRQVFRQWAFFRQWRSLRDRAARKGITIIGDIPIFVAHDSADVWANPELFFMDEECNLTVVAGVPPDYFSPTGQLWGNPLYRWDVHAETGYAWWLDRFRAVLQMVDIVRLDHFRGFAAYWEVPAGNPTAEIGQWVPTPGMAFFKHVRESLGELPIIAEDLGVITDDVIELREAFDLPSMKVIQFAFAADPDDQFYPHNYPVNCVAYTGTHDNDTTRGWFETAPQAERDLCLHYLDSPEEKLTWEMIRVVWGSSAIFSLAPMQDLLGLGSEARMNFPGKPSGNWDWRMSEPDLSPELAEKIWKINYLYNRLNPKTTREPVKTEEEQPGSGVQH